MADMVVRAIMLDALKHSSTLYLDSLANTLRRLEESEPERAARARILDSIEPVIIPVEFEGPWRPNAQVFQFKETAPLHDHLAFIDFLLSQT
jgi:hypothetical protein